MRSKEIGWGEKENLLWEISKQLDRIISIGSKVQLGTNLNPSSPEIPEGAIMNKSGTFPILTKDGNYIIIKTTMPLIPLNAIMIGDNYIMTRSNEYITTKN